MSDWTPGAEQAAGARGEMKVTEMIPQQTFDGMETYLPGLYRHIEKRVSKEISIICHPERSEGSVFAGCRKMRVSG
jgi:hypothetical protein